jgi:hypothetical protein
VFFTAFQEIFMTTLIHFDTPVRTGHIITINVRHYDGTLLGRIKNVPGGYRYYPKGVSVKHASPVYDQLQALKNTLSDED